MRGCAGRGLRRPISHPVGLAAGMDKNGVALPAWPRSASASSRSHGHRARAAGQRAAADCSAPGQRGDHQPDGFNNAGAAALARAGSRRWARRGQPLGVSLGKSKSPRWRRPSDDYLNSYRLLHRFADLHRVNVSSAQHIPACRALQDNRIAGLLRALAGPTPSSSRSVRTSPTGDRRAARRLPAEGAARRDRDQHHAGPRRTRPRRPAARRRGGRPVRPAADRAGRKVVHFVHSETGGRLPVIGVGWIMDAGRREPPFDAGRRWCSSTAASSTAAGPGPRGGRARPAATDDRAGPAMTAGAGLGSAVGDPIDPAVGGTAPRGRRRTTRQGLR